jgi:hypothetical protein
VYMGVDESDLLLANAEVLARNEIGKRYRGHGEFMASIYMKQHRTDEKGAYVYIPERVARAIWHSFGVC